MTGSTELGQGSHTVLPQIAAEELGIAYDKVNVVSSDTAITPYDRSTGASRTTTLMGSAVMEACQEAIQQMVVMAADVLKVKNEQIQTVRGGVRCGEVQLDWSQVISKFYALPDGEVIGRSYIRKSGKFAALPVFWEAAATGVEISVDEDTGKITMEKLATVGDVGLAINPALAEGQDIGAATMGMGIGLFEELVYEGSQLMNGSILDYRLPRFSDLAETSRTPPGAKPRRRRPLRRQRRRRSVAEFHGSQYRQRRRPRRRRAHPPSAAHARTSLARAERKERMKDEG